MREATSVSNPRTARRLRPFLPWAILLTFAGALMFGIYAAVVFSATWAPCGSGVVGGIGYAGGGGPGKTYLTAGVIGVVLWVAAGIAGWCFPRRHGRLLLAFVLLYVFALVVLWEITPAIWGKGVCGP